MKEEVINALSNICLILLGIMYLIALRIALIEFVSDAKESINELKGKIANRRNKKHV